MFCTTHSIKEITCIAWQFNYDFHETNIIQSNQLSLPSQWNALWLFVATRQKCPRSILLYNIVATAPHTHGIHQWYSGSRKSCHRLLLEPGHSTVIPKFGHRTCQLCKQASEPLLLSVCAWAGWVTPLAWVQTCLWLFALLFIAIKFIIFEFLTLAISHFINPIVFSL